MKLKMVIVACVFLLTGCGQFPNMGNYIFGNSMASSPTQPDYLSHYSQYKRPLSPEMQKQYELDIKRQALADQQYRMSQLVDLEKRKMRAQIIGDFFDRRRQERAEGIKSIVQTMKSNDYLFRNNDYNVYLHSR